MFDLHNSCFYEQREDRISATIRALNATKLPKTIELITEVARQYGVSDLTVAELRQITNAVKKED